MNMTKKSRLKLRSLGKLLLGKYLVLTLHLEKRLDKYAFYSATCSMFASDINN